MAQEKQVLKEAIRRALASKLTDRGSVQANDLDLPVDRILKDAEASLEREAAALAEQLKTAAAAEVATRADEPKEECFQRLSLNLRLQHVTMLSSVLVLIITGLPLKFHNAAVSHFVMNLLGGISSSAFIHRLAATALIFVGVYHLFYTIAFKAGRRDFLSLLPRPQDAKDYWQQIKYFLGRTHQKARFGRFSYIEKFDYWAVYWGMIIMIGSGSMLWFENIVLSFLPKFILDIAKEAHSDEALLATLAIIIWHFYNVHLNPHKFPMSKIWITGKISRQEMLEEHALEYEEIMRQRAEQKSQSSPPERIEGR